jgi:hypothetical protein
MVTCKKLFKDAKKVEMTFDTINIDLGEVDIIYGIYYKKPSGATGSWKSNDATPTVTHVNTTKIRKTFVAGDLDEASTKEVDWEFQTYVLKTNGFENWGCVYNQRVEDHL